MRPAAARPRPRQPAPRAAEARVVGHFGEILQGRLGPAGPVVLATAPCSAFFASARFAPAPPSPLRAARPPDARVGALEIETNPSALAGLALSAARAALEALRAPETPGTLHLETTAPPGGGAGSSTLIALSSIRALAAAWGRGLSTEAEAALCLAIEGAVDPLMAPAPGATLWASREARAVAALPAPPLWRVVGGFFGPGRPTDPTDQDFADVSDLAEQLRDAAARGDLRALGRVATQSAERNQRRAPSPVWPELRALAERIGAAGVVAAHTGSGLGLLLDPAADPGPARRALSGLGGRAVFDALSVPPTPP